MSLDNLLLWLSAKGEGSWSQFRGGVEELHVEEDGGSASGEESAREISTLPPYQRVRLGLQRLAHVEFSSKEGVQRWRVVPPTVALLPVTGCEGLLCGARSPDLLEGLDHLTDIKVVRSDAPGMPQRILLRGPSREAVASAAKRLDFHVQMDAPGAILTAAPGVKDSGLWRRTEIPVTPGWIVHRFSASRLSWVEASNADARATRSGLFRFVMKHQRFCYLRWRGRSYSVPVQVGKYAVIRQRHGILTYDAEAEVLSVPAICRPPLLIERALVLCSGFLPRFNPASGRVEYASVPPSVTMLAAQLLRQTV